MLSDEIFATCSRGSENLFEHGPFIFLPPAADGRSEERCPKLAARRLYPVDDSAGCPRKFLRR